jgi:ABC-type uncharacterized transport system involved in gliding motility auxiliary subunit
MKPEWKQYAPWSLWFSLVTGLVTAGWYFVQREFNVYIQVGIVLTVVGLILRLLMDPDSIRYWLGGRQAKYGSNALLVLLGIIGIVVLVNYLANQYPQRWDLTEDANNTLAPETEEILANLPGKVQVTAFYSDATQTENARQILDNFTFASDGNFDYEFVNPQTNPLRAQAAEITQDRTVVLTLGDKREAVTFLTEQELAGALVRLISGESRVVYFLTGHSEWDPTAQGDDSYALLNQSLTAKGYGVATLNLLAMQAIPEDADVVVVAGPLVPVSQAEVDLIADFVTNGGGLIVLSEPPIITDTLGQSDPLANYLAETWNILLSEDLVVDRQSQSNFDAVAFNYANHPVTQKMEGVAVIFPTSRSVQTGEPLDAITTVDLITTAPWDTTWAETDMEGLIANSVAGDETTDLVGPVTVAMLAQNFDTGARVAVFGDSDFASNVYFQQQNNGLMLINTVDWVAEQEDLINLTPRTTTTRVLVPPFPLYGNLVILVMVCLIPGVFVVAGVVVFFQRRRRL